jgi:parvulin-like peptidyl-prolyl isomerase
MRAERTLCLALLLLSACQNGADGAASSKPGKPAAESKTTAPAVNLDQTVLKVGDRRVSLAELARVMGPPPQVRLRISEHERRVTFLQEMERTELLAMAAQSRGYFDDPGVKASRKVALTQHLIDDLFGSNGTQIAPVTPEDVRAYYTSHPQSWTTPEQVRARQILLKDRGRAVSLLEQIKKAPADPVLFSKLAHENSFDTRTRERGGDLGRFSREVPPPSPADIVTTASMTPPVVPASVREAAFALAKPGDLVAEPVKSELGYHIVQLLAHYPSSTAQLPQVQHIIGDQLRAERQQAAVETFTKSLYDAAHVQVNAEALAHVKVMP